MTGCWSEIENLAGSTLHTLARRRPFDVVEVTDTYAVVRPHVHNISRRIPRSAIEDACNDLVENGQITAQQIKLRYADFHSAFVCALLTALPDIVCTLNPVTLYAGSFLEAQLAFDGDAVFPPPLPQQQAHTPPDEPPPPSTRFRERASFGKRMEYVIIAELLRRGFDVYQTLVDDQGIDCILRLDKEDEPCYMDIQIKARSKDIKPSQAALFAGMDIPDPRSNFYFVFYAEQVDIFWVIPSFELVDLAIQSKKGRNKGKYTINLCRKKAGEAVPNPKYDSYQGAFNLLEC